MGDFWIETKLHFLFLSHTHIRSMLHTHTHTHTPHTLALTLTSTHTYTHTNSFSRACARHRDEESARGGGMRGGQPTLLSFCLVFTQNTKETPVQYKLEEAKQAKKCEGQKFSPLDHNHTHFLLVDDGTVGKPAGEIKFRTDLEKFISTKGYEDKAGRKGLFNGSFTLSVEYQLIPLNTSLCQLSTPPPAVWYCGCRN